MYQPGHGIFFSLIKVSKKSMGKLVDAMIIAQQLNQSSQGFLHAGEQDVSLAVFCSMETAFNHSEG